jgi:hypothetical protein
VKCREVSQFREPAGGFRHREPINKNKETPAQFQERCAQIALACFWSEREATTPTNPALDHIVPHQPARVTRERKPDGILVSK